VATIAIEKAVVAAAELSLVSKAAVPFAD